MEDFDKKEEEEEEDGEWVRIVKKGKSKSKETSTQSSHKSAVKSSEKSSLHKSSDKSLNKFGKHSTRHDPNEHDVKKNKMKEQDLSLKPGKPREYVHGRIPSLLELCFQSLFKK